MTDHETPRPEEVEALHAQYHAVETIHDSLKSIAENPATAEMAEHLAAEAQGRLEGALSAVSDETRTYFSDTYAAHAARASELERTKETLESIGSDIPDALASAIEDVHHELDVNVDLQLAARLLGDSVALGVGAVAPVARIEPVPVPATPAQTPPAAGSNVLESAEAIPEIEPRAIVKIGYVKENEQAILRVAKRHWVLSSRKYESQKDYSSLRLAAVHFLIENPNETYFVSEVWEGIHKVLGVDTPDFDGQTMGQIRRFFNVLKYGNQQIIEQEKRGPSSTYNVNPRLRALPQSDISVDDIRELHLSIRETLTVSESDGLQESDESEIAVEDEGLKLALEAVDNMGTARVEQIEALLPTAQEISPFVAMFNLHENAYRELFQESQPNLVMLIEVSQQVLPSLEEASRQSPDGGTLTDEDILDLRTIAYEKMKRLFADETFLNDSLAVLRSKNDQYSDALFEMLNVLVDLSEEEWDELQTLLDVKFHHEVTMQGGSFSTGERIVSITPVNTHPSAVEADMAGSPYATLTGDEDEVEIDLEITEEIIVIDVEGFPSVLDEPEIDDEVVDDDEPEAQLAADERVATAAGGEAKKDDWKVQFRQDVNEAIKELDEQHLLTGQNFVASRLSFIASSNKAGTNTAIERLVSAGLMSKSNQKQKIFEPWQIVASHLFNNHPEVFSHRRNSRIARAMIKGSVKDFIEKRDRK